MSALSSTSGCPPAALFQKMRICWSRAVPPWGVSRIVITTSLAAKHGQILTDAFWSGAESWRTSKLEQDWAAAPPGAAKARIAGTSGLRDRCDMGELRAESDMRN